MDKDSLNWFAVFNEIALLFSNVFMFLFSDYIGDVEFRYDCIGNLYIYYGSIVFGINFLLIFIGMGIDVIWFANKSYHNNKWENYNKTKLKMARFTLFHALKQKPYLAFVEIN